MSHLGALREPCETGGSPPSASVVSTTARIQETCTATIANIAIWWTSTGTNFDPPNHPAAAIASDKSARQPYDQAIAGRSARHRRPPPARTSSDRAPPPRRRDRAPHHERDQPDGQRHHRHVRPELAPEPEVERVDRFTSPPITTAATSASAASPAVSRKRHRPDRAPRSVGQVPGVELRSPREPVDQRAEHQRPGQRPDEQERRRLAEHRAPSSAGFSRCVSKSSTPPGSNSAASPPQLALTRVASAAGPMAASSANPARCTWRASPARAGRGASRSRSRQHPREHELVHPPLRSNTRGEIRRPARSARCWRGYRRARPGDPDRRSP